MYSTMVLLLQLVYAVSKFAVSMDADRF